MIPVTKSADSTPINQSKPTEAFGKSRDEGDGRLWAAGKESTLTNATSRI